MTTVRADPAEVAENLARVRALLDRVLVVARPPRLARTGEAPVQAVASPVGEAPVSAATVLSVYARRPDDVPHCAGCTVDGQAESLEPARLYHEGRLWHEPCWRAEVTGRRQRRQMRALSDRRAARRSVRRG